MNERQRLFLFARVQGDEFQAKCLERIAWMDAHYWQLNHARFPSLAITGALACSTSGSFFFCAGFGTLYINSQNASVPAANIQTEALTQTIRMKCVLGS